MELFIEPYGDVSVIALQGDHLDAGNADEFKNDITPLIDGHKKIVFDMGRLQFVDSSGLGAILSCLRKAGDNGGELKLCGITSPVRSVFQITRMHRIFDMLETRDDAVRAFDVL